MISINVVCATSKGSDQPAHTRSLIKSLCYALTYSMSVKLLTEHHLELLSLKGGFTGPSEYTLVKMSHCWNSYVTAQMRFLQINRTTLLKQLKGCTKISDSQAATKIGIHLSRGTCFPAMWHFDKYRLRRACAASL